jgi:hypothetical protein
MDGINPADCDPTTSPAKESWASIGIELIQTSLDIQVTIEG